MKRFMERFDTQLFGHPDDFNPQTIETYVRSQEVNPTNLAKALHALEYLAQLANTDLPFVFKGGTAVQLVLPGGWRRFSVDLDIQTSRGVEDVERALNKIHRRFGKEYYPYRPRPQSVDGARWFSSFVIEIPMIGPQPATIVLDILHLTCHLPTVSTPIESDFYHSHSAAFITTPTIEALFADKLTTLGPHTVGRPLDDSRNGLEYAKHIFDLSNLLPYVHDIRQLGLAYVHGLDQQFLIRGQVFGLRNSVEDLTYICSLYAMRPENAGVRLEKAPSEIRSEVKRHFQAICKGAQRRLGQFLLPGYRFPWESTREAAARIALTATILGHSLEERFTLAELERAWEIATLSTDGMRVMQGLHEKAIEALEGLPGESTWFIDMEDFRVLPALAVLWAAILDQDFLRHIINSLHQ